MLLLKNDYNKKKPYRIRKSMLLTRLMVYSTLTYIDKHFSKLKNS